jgi:hypothetical protein
LHAGPQQDKESSAYQENIERSQGRAKVGTLMQFQQKFDLILRNAEPIDAQR